MKELFKSRHDELRRIIEAKRKQDATQQIRVQITPKLSLFLPIGCNIEKRVKAFLKRTHQQNQYDMRHGYGGVNI